MTVKVFLTIDTEHSVGGFYDKADGVPVGNNRRIFGNIGTRQYGIPLMLNIADRYNIKLTFFLEVLSRYYFGHGEIRAVVDYILERGHDIQLHLHPIFLNFSLNNPKVMRFKATLADHRLETQDEIIRDGKETLQKMGVQNVIAFRAGGFSANMNTISALQKNGFLIDSSFSRQHIGGVCHLKLGKNDVFEIARGIYELPITNFIQFPWIGLSKYKLFDINGVSSNEIKWVLKQSYKNGPTNITLLMHSFSFINNSGINSTKLTVRGNIIQRFESLCKYLDLNRSKYEVRTIGSIKETDIQEMMKNSKNIYPKMPDVISILRLSEQIKERIENRNWK